MNHKSSVNLEMTPKAMMISDSLINSATMQLYAVNSQWKVKMIFKDKVEVIFYQQIMGQEMHSP